MITQEFINTFQRHLLVGEPKRMEIIDELKHHLQEEPPEALGNPKKIAQKYNAVYLGFLHSLPRIFLSQVILFFLIEQVMWRLVFSLPHVSTFWFRNTANFMTFFEQVAPFILMLAISYTLAHVHNRTKRFFQFSLVWVGCLLVLDAWTLYQYIQFPQPEQRIWHDFFTSTLPYTALLGIQPLLMGLLMVHVPKLWKKIPQHHIAVDVIAVTIASGILGFSVFYVLENFLRYLVPGLPWQVYNAMTPWSLALSSAGTMAALVLLHRYRLQRHKV